MRTTYTGVMGANAWCETCSKHWQSRNAIGVAARHHDATGHYVQFEQIITGSYGEPPAVRLPATKENA